MSELRGVAAALALGLIVSLSAAAQEQAKDWPNRPIRVIVPFPAGGSNDLGARVVGEFLSRSLHAQIVVENKSGANGNIGIEAAAKSPADGYTVLVSTDSVASNPHVYKMNIDPLKDLLPIIQVSRQPMLLAAHSTLGIASLAELVAIAKQQPGLRYATGGGYGTPQHIMVQWFASIAGIKLEQVPYRGGAPAINDLVAGHIKLGSLGSTPLLPHYKAGTLRLLAQSTLARSPSLPDVPTFQEAGIKGLVMDQWLGVFAPVGTAPEIVDRLNTEINHALADAAVRESFLQSAQEPLGGTTAEFTRFARDEYDKYGRLVQQLNIKIN
jgi:tripartite-type tricarboxylate transporter receptor subunit TctC